MEHQEHLNLIAPNLSRTELPLLLPNQECFVATLHRFQQQNILFPNQIGLLSDSSPLLFHIIYKTQALKNKQWIVKGSSVLHFPHSKCTVAPEGKKVYIATIFKLQFFSWLLFFAIFFFFFTTNAAPESTESNFS